MKVLFCDPLNTQNNFYTYAKYLRQAGVDVHLLTDPTKWNNNGNNNQEWVHCLNLPYFVPFSRPLEYLHKHDRIVQFAKQFDLIMCSGLAPIWMRWTGRPFIFFTYGSDLDQLAVQGWSGDPDQPRSLSKRIVQLLIKYHLVGSLRKAQATVLAPYQIETAQRVGLKNLIFLPHIIDAQTFKPLEAGERQWARTRLHTDLHCDFILFHPTRHAWADRSLDECKGNDKVLKAFAGFMRHYHGHTKLLVMKKGWDMDKSKTLAEELGVSRNVVWLTPTDRAGMCRLYNASDVTLDQFEKGVLTLIALESMACGTPVISYVKEAPDGMFYSEMPPIINVRTEDGIRMGLSNIASYADFACRMSDDGRDWVSNNCSPEAATSEFVSLFESVLQQ